MTANLRRRVCGGLTSEDGFARLYLQTSLQSRFYGTCTAGLIFAGMIAAERVVVFVDYQNAYRWARASFHNHRTDPYRLGQFNPERLGALIVRMSRDDAPRTLAQVRVYRGMPDNRRDPTGYRAARRQIAEWVKSPLVHVTSQPLRYPRDYPASPAQEKGVDVRLAIDFVMMAVRGEYDVGVLMSNDTDFRPALEEVAGPGAKMVEVAAWRPLTAKPRRVWIGQNRPWCNWIDHSAYQTIQGATDYARRNR